MSKIFRGALLGGFRRSDVIRYLETLDARQKDDLARRERETEDARKQADQAYAELSAAREAAANLRAALAAQRSENARLSKRAGELEQQQSALQESLHAAGDEQKRAAAADGTELRQLSQLCDRLDEALLRLDELMRDSHALDAPADAAAPETAAMPETPAAAEMPAAAETSAAPAAAAPKHTALSDLLERVRPR